MGKVCGDKEFGEFGIKAIKQGFRSHVHLSDKSAVFRGHCYGVVYKDLCEQLKSYRPSELEQIVFYREVVDRKTGARKRQKVSQDCPRYTAIYGAPYYYSDSMHPSQGPFPPCIERFVEQATKVQGRRPDSAVINWYDDGSHYIGPHSDDETQLEPGAPIFSYSFGAKRKFRIRHLGSKAISEDIELPHGTALIMYGDMQKEFTHEVVKIAGKKGREAGSRINVTFRWFRQSNTD